jgi:hypothetical protein
MDHKNKHTLIVTKTANFGEILDAIEEKQEHEKSLSIDNSEKAKSSKRISFRKEVDVINIQSYKEFNIQVINEKSNEICGDCKGCIMF